MAVDMDPVSRDPSDDTIAVAEAPAIPGLRFRHYHGLADIPAMSAVAEAANRARGSTDLRSVEDMMAVYSHLSNCDPDLDIVLAELEGRVVAYARTMWSDRFDGSRAFEGVCFVEPSAAGRGIEDVLLRHGVRRQTSLAAELGTLGDPARPALLVRFADAVQPARIASLESLGFRAVRRYAEMTRASLADIPDLAVPDGIELRRIDPSDAAAIRRAYDLNTEVFSEHWGENEPTPEDWAVFQASPETQPALWCVAVDVATGQEAGHILNYLAPPEPDRSIVGFTESIAVRAPYRRRGLASAMLAESLRIVRNAGATSAALGVDQQNEHRAMALYERLGFRVSLEEVVFERPIDLGEAAR